VVSMKDKIAIVGVGYTPQGKVFGRSTRSLYIEAVKNAIEDAGLKKDDVDGILVQTVEEGREIQLWGIVQDMGMHTRICSQQQMYGATAGGMVLHASAALLSGLANYVVCVYAETPLTPELGVGTYGRGWGDTATFGLAGATMQYAMAAQRAMHEFRTGPETWAEIAVSQRKWANLNPRAMMYNKKMTKEDYYNSKMIAEPFRLFDSCQVSNSGRAFILTTAERARDCRHRPVYVMGVGQCHTARDITHSDTLAGPTGAKLAGKQAFKMAGITLKDIDACEIYDCFTYTAEITLQDYGFFGPGEGKSFYANGRTAPGGELPVNTSGGLLSESYQMGFTPLTEAVVQLQGSAGERQLGPKTKTKEPEIILVSGNGGVLQTHVTTILRR
jgi:acetyl-CoA acetyltransferase